MNPRPLPQDPAVRELIGMMRARSVTRRALLAGASAGGAALLLAACSPADAQKRLTPATDGSASHQDMVWTNWRAYLDGDDDGGHPSLKDFRDKTGIDVSYDADVTDNHSYFQKTEDRLAAGKSIGTDTVCLSGWMVARLIRFGYVQSFDSDSMPNTKNMLQALHDVDFDPGRKRSIPWQAGYAGICWNKKAVPGGLKSVSDLWDPSFAGKVGVLSEMRDTMGLILLDRGVDISGSFSDHQFESAVDVLTKQVHDGQIHNIAGTSYLDDLRRGVTVAAICWSSDITQLNAEAGDNWEFALPEAGGTLFSDDFVVPMGSARKANVEKLIDYYYQPEIAAEVAAWVNCLTPVAGAQEAAATVDPKLAEDPLIFPDDDMLERAYVFPTLSHQREQNYQAAFHTVLLGS